MGRSTMNDLLDLDGPHTLMKKLRESGEHKMSGRSSVGSWLEYSNTEGGASDMVPATPLQQGRGRVGLERERKRNGGVVTLSLSSVPASETSTSTMDALKQQRGLSTGDMGFLFGRDRARRDVNPPGYDRYYTAVWDRMRATGASCESLKGTGATSTIGLETKRKEQDRKDATVVGDKKVEDALQAGKRESVELKEEVGTDKNEEASGGSTGTGELSQKTQDLKKQVEDLRDSVFSAKCRNLLGLSESKVTATPVGGVPREGRIEEEVCEEGNDKVESSSTATNSASSSSSSCFANAEKLVLRDLKWDSAARGVEDANMNLGQDNGGASKYSSPSVSARLESEKHTGANEGGLSTDERGGFTSDCSFGQYQTKGAGSGADVVSSSDVGTSTVSLPAHFYSDKSVVTVRGSCEAASSHTTGPCERTEGEKVVRSGGEKSISNPSGEGHVIASVSTVGTPSVYASGSASTDNLPLSDVENQNMPCEGRTVAKFDKGTSISINAGNFNHTSESIVLRDAGNIKPPHPNGNCGENHANDPVPMVPEEDKEVEKEWLPQLVPSTLLQSFGIDALLRGTATKLPDQFHLHLHFPQKTVECTTEHMGAVDSKQKVPSNALVAQKGEYRPDGHKREGSLPPYITDLPCEEDANSKVDDGNSSWAALRVLCKTMDETVQVACQKLSEGEPGSEKNESWGYDASAERISGCEPVNMGKDMQKTSRLHHSEGNPRHGNEKYHSKYRESFMVMKNGKGHTHGNRSPGWLESWLASQGMDDSFIEPNMNGSIRSSMDRGPPSIAYNDAIHNTGMQQADLSSNRSTRQKRCGTGRHETATPAPAEHTGSRKFNKAALEMRQDPHLYKDGFAAGTMKCMRCKDPVLPQSNSSGQPYSHPDGLQLYQLNPEMVGVRSGIPWPQMPASYHSVKHDSKPNSSTHKGSAQNVSLHHTQANTGVASTIVDNNTGSDYSIPGSLSASAIERSIDEADAEWRIRQAELLHKVKLAGNASVTVGEN